MHKFLPSILALAVMLTACPANPAPDPSTQTIIPQTTKVADASTLTALSASQVDKNGHGTMKFSSDSPALANLKVGDVMVGGPTSVTPNGFLRKVTAITRENGQTDLETIQANLTDAISQGSLRAKTDLTPSDVQSTTTAFKGVSFSTSTPRIGVGDGFNFKLGFNHSFIPINSSNAHGQITVDGDIEFNAGYGVNLDISACFHLPPVCVNSFEAKVGFDQSSHLTVAGDASGQFQEEVFVGSQAFKPQVFFIGPVPVWITPRINLYLSMKGTIEVKFNFSASESATAQLGARWTDDNGWQDISGFGLKGNVQPPTFDGTIKPRVGAKSSASLKVYDSAGVEVSLEGGLELDGAVPRNPTWILNGFLKGTVGFVVDLPIIGTLVDYHKTLFDEHLELGRAGNTPSVLTVVQAVVNVDIANTVFLGPNDPFRSYYTANDAEDGLPLLNIDSSVDGHLPAGDFTFPSLGSRVLTITAIDSRGAQTRINLTINVMHRLPTARIFPLANFSSVPQGVEYYAMGIGTDADGNLLSCDHLHWSTQSGDGSEVKTQGCEPKFVFSHPGGRGYTLTVTDDQGGSVTTFDTVTVDAPVAEHPPQLQIGGFSVKDAAGNELAPNTILPPSELTLSLDVLFDGTFSVLIVNWFCQTTNPDGTVISSESVTHDLTTSLDHCQFGSTGRDVVVRAEVFRNFQTVIRSRHFKTGVAIK